MAKTKKTEAHPQIEVTLAKGQSLVGPGVEFKGGDTLSVSLECAARWQERGMIEPMAEDAGNILAAYLAAKEAPAADAPAAADAQVAADAQAAKDAGAA
jgi:hypothetical protein